MSKSETMRLRLLELADKRTAEYESVLYLVANAKCLLKFVQDEEEQAIEQTAEKCDEPVWEQTPPVWDQISLRGVNENTSTVNHCVTGMMPFFDSEKDVQKSIRDYWNLSTEHPCVTSFCCSHDSFYNEYDLVTKTEQKLFKHDNVVFSEEVGKALFGPLFENGEIK
jgi:hypothetical protein